MDIIEQLLKEISSNEGQISQTETQKYLFQEMRRLSALVDDEISDKQIIAKMSPLVRKAKLAVTAEDCQTRVEQLIEFVYHTLGFHCEPEGYFNSNCILLHKVLSERKGMPISMAAIVLYLAASLDLPIFAVNFPTQLILRAELTHADGRRETRFINPWQGDYVSVEELEKWLMAEVHFGVTVTPDNLRRAEPAELLERVEMLFKMALTKEQKFEAALRLIEYRLIFSPEDPYEIRDRGMVLASMDCYQAAYEDLSYFIDQCPEDPSAMILKNEIQGLERKSKQNSLH